MAIRIFTCIQGRQKLTRAFFKQIDYLRDAVNIDLPVTFAYSEDEDLQNVEDLLTNKCQAVKAENKPISYKHNAGMNELLKSTKESHVLHLGSDNFCTPKYIKYLIENPNDWVGVQGMYFYNLQKNELKKVQYFNNSHVLGAGRLFSRELLNRTMGSKYLVKMIYYQFRKGDVVHIPEDLGQYLAIQGYVEKIENSEKYCAMWVHKADRGLDNMSHNVLRQMGYKAKAIDAKFSSPQIVDVKTDVNITPWERLKGNNVDVGELEKIIKVDLES